MRASLDRFISILARFITRGLYQSVELRGFNDLPGGPRLFVANHFNGFVDPVVLAGALGRLPRFIAKGTLWKTPGVPWLMKVAGVLPVHRRVDGGGDNSGTFSTVVAELHEGQSVAIFPEGTTHDNPWMSPVRTGAARLALDAAHDHVDGMTIIPVGITFEDKSSLRSRVVVRAGRPLDPSGRDYCDATGAPVGSEDHEAVERLTHEIRDRLGEVSPNFESLLEAVEMRNAADLVLRTDGVAPLRETSLAQRERLAAEFGGLPADSRRTIGEAIAQYWLLASTIGVRDDHLVPAVSVRVLVRRVIITTLLVLLLLPLAVMGALVNALPVLLVALAGAAATAPVSKGTNRVLVGLIVFPATWLFVAIEDAGESGVGGLVQGWTSPLSPLIDAVFGTRSGWLPSLVVFVAAPLTGLLAVWLVEQVLRLVRTARALLVNLNRRGQLKVLLAQRAEVLELIETVQSSPTHIAPTAADPEAN